MRPPTDIETIEARYTSESLFALMAYVWKREDSNEGGGAVGVLSGHPYAYYAFAPRATKLRGTPACTLTASPAGYGLAIPLPPPCRSGDAACELKRLINI